jgi:hypothetical protein
LEKAAASSPLFENADAILHAAPAGYRRTRSFKTKDPHGSLQLTCFRSEEAGEDYLVDADIDEAQGIDPGYRFLFT